MSVMKIFRVIMITLLMTTQYCYANNTLILTVINCTHETFSYAGVTDTYTKSLFAITPPCILPNNLTIITGTAVLFSDLMGTLHFYDTLGNDNVLAIVDYRQMRLGQPIFSFQGPQFFSVIQTETRNPEISPAALTYTAATIEIRGK